VRKITHPSLEKFRVTEGPFATPSYSGSCGMFLLTAPYATIRVIATDEGGWDHVSVSLDHRCPNWIEMNMVKELFFTDEETVVQFHPPKKDYVNIHPYCLHLWRCHDQEYKLPPKEMIL
jgi:hypothetical protein